MAGETSEQERTDKKIDVSVPQVTGGALASVTAAALGSQLGVAGTFWGAGLTSVVITVGGAVYQRSLERGREKANEAAAKAKLKRRPEPFQSNRPETGRRPGQPPATDPDLERTQRYGPVSPPGGADERTRRTTMGDVWPGERRAQPDSDVDPDARTRQLRWDGTQYVPVAAQEQEVEEQSASSEDRARPRRGRLVMVAMTGLLMFGLCMVIITTFEGVTGKPLSGGQQGTSIGTVLSGSTRSTDEGPGDHEPGQPPAVDPDQETSPQTGEGEPEEPGDGSSPGSETGEGESPGDVETPGDQPEQEPGQEPSPEPPANEQPQDTPADEPGLQQELPEQQSEPG